MSQPPKNEIISNNDDTILDYFEQFDFLYIYKILIYNLLIYFLN